MSLIERVLTDVKTGATVAAGTVGSGLATLAEKIPVEIGRIATLVGIVLSCVLIFTHIKRYIMDSEVRRKDIELKDLQIAALRRSQNEEGGQ